MGGIWILSQIVKIQMEKTMDHEMDTWVSIVVSRDQGSQNQGYVLLESVY